MRFAFAALAVAAIPVLAAACSEPVPQSADGAFYYTTTFSSTCTGIPAGSVAQVGVIDAYNRKTVITDGQNGTHVACELLNATAPFKFHGQIDDAANSAYFLEIHIDAISPSATADAPATGTATIAAPWTAGNPFQGACNFYFESNSQGVGTGDTGKLWVSFQCPDGLAGPMASCPLKQGYAIFENCSTTDEATE